VQWQRNNHEEAASGNNTLAAISDEKHAQGWWWCWTWQTMVNNGGQQCGNSGVPRKDGGDNDGEKTTIMQGQ
jgi:hypothetical protein